MIETSVREKSISKVISLKEVNINSPFTDPFSHRKRFVKKVFLKVSQEDAGAVVFFNKVAGL